MIISKPKGNTLFALGMFLLICFGLLGYTLFNFITYDVHYWYQYLIFIIITPVSFVVAIKAIKSYKIIKLGKGKISVDYPFLLKKQAFNMQNLESWTEEIIKTQGTDFKELKLKFSHGKIHLTSQENSEYLKIYSYLKKKYPRKFM